MLWRAAAADLNRIFPGTSEMAGRMREFDWSQTLLGMPTEWPEPLLAALSLCLLSRFPMQLWWGAELTLFYNDGCIPIFGRAKHPAALGRSGREVWSDNWRFIGPGVEGAMARGEASWSEDSAMFCPPDVAPEDGHVTASFSPIAAADGSIAGALCTCLRVGTAKQNVAKDYFLSTLSHELRTPLSAVLGWTQLLLRGGLGAQETVHALQAIETNAIQQNKMIDDLLDVSQVVMGKLALNKSVVPLEETVHAVLSSVQARMEEKGIEFQVEIAAENFSVAADPTRLHQVVHHLLANAMKFTPAGGQIHLTVRRESPSQVALIVSDNGKGICPRFLPHVFSRFSQGDPSTIRRHGGLGLGLALVRSFVELMDGTITAHSDGTGKGATFTVLLPLLAPAPLPSAVGNVSDSRQDDAPIADATVLVVDDDPSNREMISAVLESFGAKVYEASSAPEAFSLFNVVKPEVLVSDLAMPGEDGFSLIRRIRAQESQLGTPHTPAIALTAHAGADNRARALVSGFQAHLTKPADFALLVRTIRRLRAC